jgi:hypothetical protein
MSVERLLKLAMTGGAGVEKSPSKRTAQGMPHTGEQQTEGNTTSTSEQTEEDTTDGAE